MPSNWSKGYTKETHPSVMKISQTMKKKRIDNFAKWRRDAVRKGELKVNFPLLPKNGDLAELIGVILGDGHIEKFPRTERLLIFSNSNNAGFVKRYTDLVERLFEKETYVYKQSKQNCVRISLYQKKISERLGIPTGARKDLELPVPKWISKNKKYIVRYLRGLYEAEGSFCVHEPTYTHKFQFSNKNESLLKNVDTSLKTLGFHPHRSRFQVQVSKKEEVYKVKELLKFRMY